VILLHRIRFLFQGWKRFSILFQTILWGIQAVCVILMGARGIQEGGLLDGRLALGLFFAFALGIIYFLNRNRYPSVRVMGLMALGWTTLLWVEMLLPGKFSSLLQVPYLRKMGWDYFVFAAFSFISLFGLGYPFAWLGGKRILLMTLIGFLISITGFLLMGGIVVLERSAYSICSQDLIYLSLSIIVLGSIILGRVVQDCLEEGETYWHYVPYVSAATMFLLTMMLWTSFQIHERRSWTRELETVTTKMGDKLEQKLISHSQNLERFCLMVSLREKLRLEEWRVETRTLMDHEGSILGFDRFPPVSTDWKVRRSGEMDFMKELSSSDLNAAIESCQRNRMVWATSPFLTQNNQRGVGLVGIVGREGQKPWWMVMGLDFNQMSNSLFHEEGDQIYTRIMVEGVILRDFEGEVDLSREHPYESEFYFHGVNFSVMTLPKDEFFIRRDQFLSVGFLTAGFCFSVLFGTLAGLYIQTHLDSLQLRGVNDQLEFEIADRRRAEETTEQKNRDLETLIYVVSHDLREPLRGIESFSRLIYERYLDRLDEKGQDFLRRIVFSSMRLDRLLDDITTLSRVQRAEAPSVPVNARELVMEALGRLETAIKAKGATIDIARDLPALWVNRTWGTQAIFNLIGNAVKFSMPEVPPTIEVLGYRSEGGNLTGIRILDRGPGVKAEHVDRIFKLFQRAVGREVEGTGAGLAIVKQIAERHGGSVWYEDREGGGSCFTITFAVRHDSLPPREGES
jgi:signal transduction histidine kinase